MESPKNYMVKQIKWNEEENRPLKTKENRCISEGVPGQFRRCAAWWLTRQEEGLGTNLLADYVLRGMSASRCKGAERGAGVERVSK
jgi:hypothetical protein